MAVVPRRRVAGCGRGDPHAASHTVELNAGIVDTDSGAQLYADWMWHRRPSIAPRSTG
ncbi:hypothetical protein I553_7957 [Mycobacterium xenopi 4042]|uniref:Uncharacterized protein n=1 Tax=Mycobacterium xenopi 4042 TaxID=1299334 RepID=X8DB44_MYCXE|nr:hypothetical protein I553_7957 [Mycobacterium xenopi 4042]